MKWFDSLFSDKHSDTFLKERDSVEKNHSHKSYRDIKKRAPILSLSQWIFDPKKSYTPFSIRRNIQKFYHVVNISLSSCTRRHWVVVCVLLILSYCIYGLGFIIRTEIHLNTLRDNPDILLTQRWLEMLGNMREDYQIIAPIIQNPIFPIEPLATYGRALRIGYDVVSRVEELSILEVELMAWKNTSSTQSIFLFWMKFFLGSERSMMMSNHCMKWFNPKLRSSWCNTSYFLE